MADGKRHGSRPGSWLRRLLVMAAAGFAGLLVGACGGPGGPGAAATGGTIVVGMRADFAGINSITNTALFTDELIKYGLFMPLIQYDEDLQPVPYLAESWEMLGDTGVVFRLRRDVSWHDGQPVTAADVTFTFERAKDPNTASLLGSAYLSEVRSAEALDSFTVRFDFERPHAQALEDFWWAPMPRHLLEDVPAAELASAPFNRQPVGNGPYRFVEWRANDRMVLERNDRFPEALSGPPRPDRIVFRIVPEATTLVTELLTGAVDLALPIEPEQAPELERAQNVELSAVAGRTFYYIGWNNAREPFTDRSVRRAMALGIDRDQIVEGLLYGFGQAAVGPVPPWHPLAPSDLAPLPYDPEAAERLLDAAGWQDRNGDGIREDAAGRPLRWTLLVSDRLLTRNIAAAVQAQLRRIGVEVQIRALEFQTLLSLHRNRDFDAVLSAWVLDNFQLASTPMSLFHSRWVPVPGSANRSSFADPRADSLIEAGAAATDPAESRRIWRELTQLLQEEQPITFLFWAPDLTGIGSRVGGVIQDARGQFVSMKDWYVAAGR